MAARSTLLLLLASPALVTALGLDSFYDTNSLDYLSLPDTVRVPLIRAKTARATFREVNTMLY